ncbi:MAG: hypothetical protein V4760_13800, partial [Bdellovibrionota bacterium]
SLGEMYARQAEQAFAAVSPSFGVWPRRTVLVVDDTTDVANGFATAFPYPTITAFPVLPSGLDVVAEYGDWGFELLTHEYTHILTFEPSTGVFRPLRWIFGGIMRPNVFLPRWYTEGLAVEIETRFTRHGRLRSNGFLAIARSMVEEGTLRDEDIGRINEAIPGWPGGNRPYLMGSLIWDEITRRGGDKMIGELNLAYSRRIPFFIDGPLRDRLDGIDYENLLDLTYKRIETRANAQIDKIVAAGSPEFREFRNEGLYSHTPVVSPDGLKLAHVGRAHNIDAFVRVVERADTTKSFRDADGKIVTEGEAISRVSWLPDSLSFVYDSVGTDARYYSYSDLYRFDLAEKKAKPITKGLRAREAVVAGDGKSVVFVQLTPGGSRLACLPIDGKGDVRVLYTPPVQTRLSRPEFLDQTRLVFGERRDDGNERLKTLAVEWRDGCFAATASEPTVILPDFVPAQFPRMTRDGLMFVSDRTGIANVYLANAALTDAKAITNTTTRVMNADLDHATGEVIVSRLEAGGLRLITVATPKTPLVPPTVGSLVETEWPKFEVPKVEVKTTPEEYSPWPHLVPRYWMPFAFVVPDGAYVQASTSAADPVGRHAYALTAAYDSLTERPSAYGQYVNSTTPVQLAFAGEDINEYLYSGGFIRHSTSASLTGSFFLPKMSEKWRGALGWQYLQTDALGLLTLRNGARASVLYSNASQMGFEISPEKGGAFSVSQARFFPDMGNIEYEQTDLTGIKYLSGWILPERHVLTLSASASVAPRLNRALLGRSTVGGNYQNGLIQNAFVMRGFPSGAFLGRNMIAATAEYRFPLAYPYRGFGTNPIFLRRLHADVFVDAISLDGLAYDRVSKGYRAEKLGRTYFGMGGELKFDTTTFYSIPIQFILGYYYGADERLNPYRAYPFIGIGL